MFNSAIRRARFILLLLLVLSVGAGLCATPALGQIDLRPGVRVGVNAADIGGDGDEFASRIASEVARGAGDGISAEASTKRLLGLTAGGFLVIDFPGPGAVQPGLRYMQRGYRYDINFSNGVTAEETLSLDYIEIPIFARYDLPLFSSRFRPHVIAGPTVGFNITSGITSEVTYRDGIDPSDGINSVDAGLEAGVGIEAQLIVTSFVIDARYGLGVTPINDDDTDLVLKHRALIVTLGFAF